MSTLSTQIALLPYIEGKIAIYKSCKASAIEHIEFWNSPQRHPTNGLSPAERAKCISSAQEWISRCDEKIKFWQKELEQQNS